MALVCNHRQLAPTQSDGDAALYVDAERYIEAGSAYFGQAFAEALGLISDIELHNRHGARLRTQSIACLLEHALRQYKAAVEISTMSGLSDYHARKLEEAGLEANGVRRVLAEAVSRRFLMDDDDRIARIAVQFDRRGHAGLMSLYIDKVQHLHALAVSAADTGSADDGVAAQELGWRLTSLFADALETGKALAVLNTFTFRLPTGTLSSSASLQSAPKLNS